VTRPLLWAGLFGAVHTTPEVLPMPPFKRPQSAQDVEMVARIIVQTGMSLEQALVRDALEGWTFNVRYEDAEYANEEAYTRVVRRSIGETGIRVAVLQAKSLTTQDPT
jgi:hypothetical protein